MDFSLWTERLFIPSVNLSLQLLSSRKPSSNSSSKTFNFHILGLKISILPIHIVPNSWVTESLHVPHKLWEPREMILMLGQEGMGIRHSVENFFLLYHPVPVHILYMCTLAESLSVFIYHVDLCLSNDPGIVLYRKMFLLSPATTNARSNKSPGSPDF